MTAFIRTYARQTLQSLVVVLCIALAQPGFAAGADPLPSWNDGKVKADIITFVAHAADKTSDGYIPREERIATLDNDGTLWPEKPYTEFAWITANVKSRLEKDPTLAEKEPFKTAREKGLESLDTKAFLEFFLLVEGNLSVDQIQQQSAEFIRMASHPKLGIPYSKGAYAPMLELIAYLRANEFDIYICTGGSAAFVRGFAQQLYGIGPEHVIGTTLKRRGQEEDGRLVVQNEPAFFHLNDKSGKPVGIDTVIGRRPVFAAGNVGGGGDIAMLRYSQGAKHSMQLMINHDDDRREFSYQETDNASLNASAAHGWHVVSMKNDWKKLFRE